MSTDNRFTSNFRESTAENNVDLGAKFVTKSYLMDVYPYLTGMGNIRFPGLWLFGHGSFGQIGDSNSTVSNRSSPVQTIAGGTGWKQVSCGGYHTAAIKTDGTLWSTGYNALGQLGDSTVVTRSSPVQTITVGTSWRQVSCGLYHTSAIKSDGSLWSWGNGAYGQLGDSNSNTIRSSPVQTIAAGKTWKQVSCGGYHTAGIKTDGSLWLWGYSANGQLGDSVLSVKSSPVQTIALGNSWRQVSCGEFHTTAIKLDGSLWLWGLGNFGQLGDSNSNTNRSSPVQTIAGGNNWKQVAAGSMHTAAIKTDGTLWTWGHGGYGQLGDSTSATLRSSSPAQTIAGGTNWKQVSCGRYFTSAIKTDGTLWLWGDNVFGQLGDSTAITRSSPIQVITNITNWKQVSAGTFHTGVIEEMGDDF